MKKIFATLALIGALIFSYNAPMHAKLIHMGSKSENGRKTCDFYYNDETGATMWVFYNEDGSVNVLWKSGNGDMYANGKPYK